jgi:hypothetical protein
MKYKIWYSLATIALLLIVSCNPIDDRENMGHLLPVSQIKLDVHGITTGSNEIVMINNTPNTSGMWYTGISTSTKQNDTIILPFLGNSTIYFYATTAGGIVKDSVIVNVTKIDHPAAPQWEYLAGSGTAGKTWVWATDVPPAGQCWGNGSFAQDSVCDWWGNGLSALQGWGVANDQMTFDLNGGANFTLVTGNNGNLAFLPAGTYHGTFSFDMTKTLQNASNSSQIWSIGTLTFTGATVSLGYAVNENNIIIYKFNILKLNDNEMVLAFGETGTGVDGTNGTGWFYIFKRQGYSFPQ